MKRSKKNNDKSEETSLYTPSDENKLHETDAEPDNSSTRNLAPYTENLEKINTIFFTDDNGDIHALDIQRYIRDLQLRPGKDQTLRSNYFPYRHVNMEGNGMFGSK